MSGGDQETKKMHTGNTPPAPTLRGPRNKEADDETIFLAFEDEHADLPRFVEQFMRDVEAGLNLKGIDAPWRISVMNGSGTLEPFTAANRPDDLPKGELTGFLAVGDQSIAFAGARNITW